MLIQHHLRHSVGRAAEPSASFRLFTAQGPSTRGTGRINIDFVNPDGNNDALAYISAAPLAARAPEDCANSEV